MTFRRPLLAAAIVAALVPLAAHAGPPHVMPPGTVAIVDTPGPGGPFGTNGFDLLATQRVGARFTVPTELGDSQFLRGGVWLMNNSDSRHKPIRFSLQTDALDEGGLDSMPSGRELQGWTMPVRTEGWNPVEQWFGTGRGPVLQAGHDYWIVLASNSPPFVDPIWVLARKGSMFESVTNDGQWVPGASGGALTLHVDVLPLSRN